MKVIKLSKGQEAIVDDEDYEYLSQWKWCHDCGYASRTKKRGERGKVWKIFMHRIINKTPDGLETDHINRDKLDNRKCNLRSCTSSENNFNGKVRRDNKSGYKGVHWDKNRRMWLVYIGKGINGYIGRFKTLNEAVRARKSAEKKLGITYC